MCFTEAVVELLLHNLEINLQSPIKKIIAKGKIQKIENLLWKSTMETKKKNNYVVAEKLMLENISLTKWNQLESTASCFFCRIWIWFICVFSQFLVKLK